MATQYPTALDGEAQLDTSIAPTATLGNPSHSDQHENVNGAVQALEAKLGIGSSTAASSTDQMVLVSSGSTTSWGYRGVAVFADSTARDAAITSPGEGMVAYLQDVNSVTVYSGSAWVTIADPDVLAVDSANGRVGIGTASPSTSLQIQGTSNGSVDDLLLLSADGLANAGSGARLRLAGAPTETRYSYIEGLNTGGTNNAHSLLFGTNAGGSTPVERMRIDADGDVRLAGASNNFEVTTDGSNFYGLGKYYQASGSVDLSGNSGAYNTIAKVLVPKGRWLVMATGRMEFALSSAGRYFTWRIGNITLNTFVADAYRPKATAFDTGTYIPMSASGVIETTSSIGQEVGLQVSQSATGGTTQAYAHLQVIGVH